MSEYKYKEYLTSESNVPRERMPQIDFSDIPKIINHFQRKGVSCWVELTPASGIKIKQSEFIDSKIRAKIKSKSHSYKSRLFIVSLDGYVVDGNHDFAYCLEMQEPGFQINALRIGVEFSKLASSINKMKIAYNKDASDSVI